MAKRISESNARALFLKNNLEPLVPFPGTQKPWKSKCQITGKQVSPTYGKVRDFGHRCKHCSGYEVNEAEAVKLMKRNGFTPLIKYPGANNPWKCLCKNCGKHPEPRYTQVKSGKNGCAYCSKRKVDPKEAEKLMNERGFKTFGQFPGATKPWSVQCLKCKRKFSTYFYSSNDKTRCKYCSGAVVDEETLKPILRKLKLTPLEKFPGSKVPWKMRCKRCNRVVTPTWSHLTRKDRNVGGCAFCSKRRVHMDDMLKLLEANKLKPIGQFINGKTPWLCQCTKCKREVFPRINDLRAGQSGCIYCAKLRVDEREAIKLAQKNGFTPLVKYPGANTGWDCICNVCGQVSKPHYTSMQQGINRCKFCATGGFDFNAPAIIYLITNDKLGAHKIGVAGAAKHNERLSKHAKQGWTLYKHREFKKGVDAFNIEGKILHWWRYQKNLPPYLSVEQMPQAGWSETVDASELDLSTIWKKVIEFASTKYE